MLGKRGNDSLWIDNYSFIINTGALAVPSFMFPDKKPRRFINVVFTFPYVSGNTGFLFYFSSSIDEVNWLNFGSQQTLNPASTPQVIPLNNSYPIRMLNMYVTNNTGAPSFFSAFVEGIYR
jgi:hypothetical protein